MRDSFPTGNENQQVKEYLFRIHHKKRIPHSLLFAGPSNVGKRLFAKAFAKLIVGTDREHHPDIHFFQPEGKSGMHSIQAIREFCECVYLTPFQSQKKVFIIQDAHRMLTYSANALLKTLEEPVENSIILLISDSPEKMLSTLLSRCQIIRFQTDESKKPSLEEKYRKQIREYLIQFFLNENPHSYLNIFSTSKYLAAQIENKMKEEEEKIKKQMLEDRPDELTAIQKEEAYKQVSGMIAQIKASESSVIFEMILSWYRDLHLLRINGDRKFLMHPDALESLTQILQKRKIFPLEKIQQLISEAKLALERSNPLDHCLENLFLKLCVPN